MSVRYYKSLQKDVLFHPTRQLARRFGKIYYKSKCMSHAEETTYQYMYTFSVTSSRKIRLMMGQKEQTMIRRRAFRAASDQSLDFLSQIGACIKHFLAL